MRIQKNSNSNGKKPVKKKTKKLKEDEDEENTNSYLLTLDRIFIKSLPLEDQLIISNNIAKELARKLYETTNSVCESWCISWDVQNISGLAKQTSAVVGKLLI